ncbi:MAG: CoA-binding protein [Chloroflexi bacterium]|nr:CoA-binding protein [Chloroflexota bacterium]
MFDFLKKVPLFADLPDEDLDRLCEMAVEERILPDETLFIEGEIGDKAYVIMAGEVDILKESGGRTVLLASRRAGEVIGEMSLLDQTPRFASGIAKTECDVLAISHENLENLLDTSPSAARVMLSTITNRLRSTEIVLRQSEKMAQLGTLTAGIAHELNNPASAARRGAEHLQTSIELFQQAYRKFYSLGFTAEQWERAAELQEFAQKQASQPTDLDSLGRSDREAELEDWLDDKEVEDGWEYAPHLVSLGYEADDLDDLENDFPGEALIVVVQWLGTLYNIYSLLEEIHQGTSRIGEIVKSLKSYVYLDQAPVQTIDLHEGLDNTLVMLRSKLKSGISLERHYDKNIPKIQGYGSELNQVWTNIIDNAVDAMDGVGKIKIVTKQKGDWVLVEIEDSGPGIPEDVQEQLFSPFFTTKPMGKGTGLGLNISYNIIQKHNGEIKVFSRSGKTCFSVRLPVNFEDVGSGIAELTPSYQSSDEHLKEILQATEKIAVVGISENDNAPGHTVPAYLQKQGYRIYPVNPKYEQVLGERAFPDLLSLEDEVDVVLVFRHSDFVPEIVQQAIQIEAKVVWMQEGIVNPDAAEIAKDAGLDVVMDICMRQTHQRLMDAS